MEKKVVRTQEEMEKKVVKTQSEFDAIPLDWEGEVEIHEICGSYFGVPQTIRDTPHRRKFAVTVCKGAYFDAHYRCVAVNDARVETTHACVDAYDRAVVFAKGDAPVFAHGQTTVRGGECAEIHLYDTATANLWGRARCECHGENRVTAYDHAMVYAMYDGCTIDAYDYTFVHAGGQNTVVTAHFCSTVYSTGCKVTACGFARVFARHNTKVVASDAATVVAGTGLEATYGGCPEVDLSDASHMTLCVSKPKKSNEYQNPFPMYDEWHKLR